MKFSKRHLNRFLSANYIVLIFVYLFFPQNSYTQSLIIKKDTSQIVITPFLSSNSKEIEIFKAVLKNTYYVVRQDYVLQDSDNEQYGQGEEEYFERNHRIGLILNGKDFKSLYVPYELVYAYTISKEFEEYSEEYLAVNTNSHVYFPDLEPFPSPMGTPRLERNYGRFDGMNEDLPALEIYNEEEKPKSGKVILFYRGKLLNKKDRYKYNDNDIDFYVKDLSNISWEDNSANFPEVKVIGGEYLGGIMLKEKYDVGKIIYSVAGIVIKNTEGWRIASIKK